MNANVHRKKLRLGMIYGAVAGFAFAFFAWGVDAWLLARANDAYYWVKFIPGLIICTLAGGLAGWLTMFLQKHGPALLFWGLVAILFTGLVIWLPYSGTPRIITLINPSLAGYFNFKPILDISQFRVISLFVIGLAAVIAGLLEINLIDQAVLSPYLSGSVVALAICLFLFGLAGSAADQMINNSVREPVQVVNSMLQFAQDNIGREVPKATAREMHLSSTRLLGNLIEKPRKLTLIAFDENLLMVDILVDFDGNRVKCSTIYSQPVDCIILLSNP